MTSHLLLLVLLAAVSLASGNRVVYSDGYPASGVMLSASANRVVDNKKYSVSRGITMATCKNHNDRGVRFFDGAPSYVSIRTATASFRVEQVSNSVRRLQLVPVRVGPRAARCLRARRPVWPIASRAGLQPIVHHSGVRAVSTRMENQLASGVRSCTAQAGRAHCQRRNCPDLTPENLSDRIFERTCAEARARSEDRWFTDGVRSLFSHSQ